MSELNPGGGGGMPDLFAKIGPLPAWGWGALAVVGYIWWSHGKSASNTAATATDTASTTDTASVPDVATSNDYGYATSTDPSSAGYDYSTVNTGGYGGTVSGTAYGSNQQWAVAAIQTLINSGVPASTATTGITLYLSGSNLTQDEANAVNTAIALIGPPPLPMPVNVASGTTATQPPTDTTPSPTPDPAPVQPVTPTPTPVDTSGGSTTSGGTVTTKVKPSVHLALSPTTVKVGQTITATVTVSGSHGTPTGEVYLNTGESTTPRGTLNNGVAKISFQPERQSSTTMEAGYEGDGTYDSAGSNGVTFHAT